MRIAVTGKQGQVVTSLIERGAEIAEIIAVGRPELDLADSDSVARSLEALRPDVVVNAAAYTMVDKAEQEAETAFRVNAEGVAAVAAAAARLGAPLIHISTDYVFDGQLDRPYLEDDPTGPTGVYGRSKLEGERRAAENCENCAILRTAWVYSPFGANFVKTMLRLGESRSELGVVADQRGNPTSALDIADGVLAIAERMIKDPSRELRGVFHMTGATEASWADFAEEIFARAERHGRAPVSVKRITTADYPTPAKRPANSRLDNSKLRRLYGVALPDWRPSLAICVKRLLDHS
ncbi:dTDP-4-dehydrorhamnose reductase [Methylocystis parvus]|uniref:dTDP-4-dehydrorhamnose reductase n=1 Tax=Methylocystis parvus TaxID=134 RepID=A0A6B8MDJ1_9HYPH|nr:dTDP-4-dehydrorhamnose reductase [Methylocystis parvus]QGM99639.1 dTDP-4-dehydrorhamnose reductase [Methylocystis parvus]WBK02072.1 dTDP-4-dehydrorhamnose reductase [Methylocystis parvus OBBP]